MIRRIIQIEEELCTGCGLCASACQEEAIAIIDGKARLLRDDYCDGLGNCLPACPTGAITFIEREADPFDEEAVLNNKQKKQVEVPAEPQIGGCPGSRIKQFSPRQEPVTAFTAPTRPINRLAQWPAQLQLVPTGAPYFAGASLLLAADCTAFAYAAFHEEFMKGRITLIACPKLDPVDYAPKLTQILRSNEIRDLTIARMEVPCCGGLEYSARRAIPASGRFIPCQVVVLSTDGRILR